MRAVRGGRLLEALPALAELRFAGDGGALFVLPRAGIAVGALAPGTSSRRL